MSAGVTSGREFLSSISSSHSQRVRVFYLYSAVMFGISFRGEPDPLFLQAAVSLAQIQLSAAPTFSWPPLHRHMFLGSNLGALVNPCRAAVGEY